MKKEHSITYIILAIIIYFLAPVEKALPDHRGSNDISVSVKLLTSIPIEISDPIDIMLTVKYPAGSTMEYPKNPDNFLPFTMTSIKEKLKKKKDTVTALVLYTVKIYSTGDITFPSLKITVDDKTFTTSPLNLHIGSSIKNRGKTINEINDIYGPIGYYPVIIITVVILCTLILIFLFVLLRRIISGSKANLHSKIDLNSTIDPILLIEMKLMKLKNSGEEIKSRYYMLSVAVKDILGLLSGKNLKTLTTSKISRIFKNTNGEEENYFINLLKYIDEVKYTPKVQNIDFKKTASENLNRIVEELTGKIPALLLIKSINPKIPGKI